MDLLKHLLEQRRQTASDLGRLLGDRALGAKILNGTRELSKAHIRLPVKSIFHIWESMESLLQDYSPSAE